MNIIGSRIKARREDLKISGDSLGKTIGKTKETIYRYESGYIKTLPSSVIYPLAAALQTTPEYLMGFTNNPSINAKTDNMITVERLEALGFDLEKLNNLSDTEINVIIATISNLAESHKKDKK